MDGGSIPQKWLRLTRGEKIHAGKSKLRVKFNFIVANWIAVIYNDFSIIGKPEFLKAFY